MEKIPSGLGAENKEGMIELTANRLDIQSGEHVFSIEKGNSILLYEALKNEEILSKLADEFEKNQDAFFTIDINGKTISVKSNVGNSQAAAEYAVIFNATDMIAEKHDITIAAPNWSDTGQVSQYVNKSNIGFAEGWMAWINRGGSSLSNYGYHYDKERSGSWVSNNEKRMEGESSQRPSSSSESSKSDEGTHIAGSSSLNFSLWYSLLMKMNPEEQKKEIELLTNSINS